MSTAWEYIVVPLPDDNDLIQRAAIQQTALNELGAAGWELIAIDEYVTAYLKRPRD